jgi:ribosomal protein S18 acetylase RimI-like enzyme
MLCIISEVRSPNDLLFIPELFITYAKWLNIDLTYQNLTHGLSNLPVKYSPPSVELLLARRSTDDSPLGCVALRPLFSNEYAEMKRLYVGPVGRCLGIGKALVQEILEIAKTLGHKEIKLDTVSHMDTAIWLYKSNGFVECEKYYDSPIEETVFLHKIL